MWVHVGLSVFFLSKLSMQRKKAKSRGKLGDRQGKKMEAREWRQDMSVLDCKGKSLRDLRHGRARKALLVLGK